MKKNNQKTLKEIIQFQEPQKLFLKIFKFIKAAIPHPNIDNPSNFHAKN